MNYQMRSQIFHVLMRVWRRASLGHRTRANHDFRIKQAEKDMKHETEKPKCLNLFFSRCFFLITQVIFNTMI